MTPLVAADIVDRHLIQGGHLMGVWRGKMGLSEEEQEAFALDRCANCACEKTEL